MRISELFKSSLATLRLNPRRTFLTMFGIIIGIAAVITILSLGNGYRQQTLDSLAKDEKGRRNQNFYFQMTSYDEDPWLSRIEPFSEKNIDHIEGLEGVDEVTFSSNMKTQEFVMVQGKDMEEFYNSSILESSQESILLGRNLHSSDSKAKKPYVLISDHLAMTFFTSTEEALHQSLQIDENIYTIVGVFQYRQLEGDEALEMGMEYYDLIIPRGTYDRFSLADGIDFEIQVYYEPEADMAQLNQQIANYLSQEGGAKDKGTYEFHDNTEWMNEIGNQLNMITYFIAAIAGISLFIAGVGVMNMMYISVTERTKEIGIRRALGAPKQAIQAQFLLEGVAITSLGGFCGYLLGLALSQIISNFLPFQAIFDVPTALISVFISVFIGLVFTAFPARQAAERNVVEILR